MKLKSFMRNRIEKETGKQDVSHSDPKEKAAHDYDRLVPVLCVVKCDGSEPRELLQEIDKSQTDPDELLLRIELCNDSILGPGGEEKLTEEKIRSLKKLTFDLNNCFLVGVGQTDFFAVDLRVDQDG